MKLETEGSLSLAFVLVTSEASAEKGTSRGSGVVRIHFSL